MKKIILLIVVCFFSIKSTAQVYNNDINKAEAAMKLSPPDYLKALQYYDLAKQRCPIKMRDDIEKKIKDIEIQKAQAEAQNVPMPKSISQASLSGSDTILTTTESEEKKTYSISNLTFPYTTIPPQKEKLLIDIKKLTTVTTKKDIKANRDEFFQILEDRLMGINHEEEARFLYDSTLTAIKSSHHPSEQLLSLHLRTVLDHGWDLLDKTGTNAKMLDSARIVIQQTINIVAKNQFNSAKWNYAISGFENLLSQYYSKVGDDNNSYKHKLLAADYMRKSVLLDHNNVYYWGSLYVYTRNFTRLQDAVLPEAEKNKFVFLSYDIANYMSKNIMNSTPQASSIMLSIKLQVLEDKYYALLSEKKQNEALLLLEKAINNNENRWLATTEYSSIFMAYTYNLISNQYINDQISYKRYTQKAADMLVYFLKNNSLSQYRWTGWFKSAFNGVVSNTDFSFSQNERTTLYKSIVSAIKEGKDDYIKNKDISYAYSYANSLLANMLISNKTQNDSIQALNYLGNSIELFERGNYLENYSAYSEDYAIYCKPYAQIIKLYIKQENHIMAKKYYDTMMKYFSPIIEKYRFDFYFMQNIIGASEAYGEFLFKQKIYKDAIAPLEFASYEGIKSSTEYLIEIYSKTNLKNQALTDSFTARNAIQSKNMKRFTFNIDCAGSSQPFHVYIMDRAIGHPYKGIADQVKWLEEARGCTVPEDVISSFNKLQDIAWENNVSFQDLCVYALGASQEETILSKYAPYKEKINNEKDTAKKSKLYEQLITIYENNIKEDTTNRKTIIGDAIKVYTEYYDYLLENNSNDKAKEIIYKTVRLSFEKDKDDVTNLLEKDNSFLLEEYYKYYLEDLDTINAKLIAYKFLIVNEEEQLKNEKDTDAIEKLKNNLSQNYNGLGWELMLTKHLEDAGPYFKKSLEYDSTNIYAKGNLAHFYLFDNQFEKAKSEYLRLKDEPFKEDKRYKTLKDAFLADFKDFEKVGITNEHIGEIISLLNKK